MSEVFNPASVEQAIAGLSNRIAKGVGVCNTTYRAFQDAQHALDLAEAKAYMAFDGPAHEKKYAAVIAVEEERRTRDLAEAALTGTLTAKPGLCKANSWPCSQ